jgi:hypothetical protein
MLGAALVLTGSVGLSGCADLRRAVFLPPVNPESPVAAQVAVGTRRNFTTPAFSNVPPAPKNVPTAPMVKTAVFTMVGCRRSFERWDRQHPAMVSDTAGFAALEQAKVDTNPADVPTKAQDAESQAVADQMKIYASPPAALPSGPPPSASELVAPPPKAEGPAPAPTPVARARPARPAKATAAAKPAPASPEPAAPTTVVAQAPSLALAPPPPAIGADPLLSHCQ